MRFVSQYLKKNLNENVCQAIDYIKEGFLINARKLVYNYLFIFC